MIDFDTAVERRGSDSLKYARCPRGTIPMWVADMDFPSPPAVLRALAERVDHGIFGYGTYPADLSRLLVERLAELYGWAIRPSWIVYLPGIVSGLNICCRAFAGSGEAVVTTTPIYPPFMTAPELQGRQVRPVPMAVDAQGRATFDVAGLDRAAAESRMLLLCSPYNPCGRAFSAAELGTVLAVCEARDLTVVSDEIWCDLILDDRTHVPFASLSEAAAERTITFMAPSKTWNLAGLSCSLAIIPDPHRRDAFKRAARGIVPEVNVLAFAAAAAAYSEGEAWRRELLAYLRGNRDEVQAFVRACLPAVSMAPVEATYLAWIDVRALGWPDAVGAFRRAGVMLSDGATFGAPGFVRLNFGCRRALLREALSRLATAVSA